MSDLPVGPTAGLGPTHDSATLRRFLHAHSGLDSFADPVRQHYPTMSVGSASSPHASAGGRAEECARSLTLPYRPVNSVGGPEASWGMRNAGFFADTRPRGGTQ